MKYLSLTAVMLLILLATACEKETAVIPDIEEFSLDDYDPSFTDAEAYQFHVAYVNSMTLEERTAYAKSLGLKGNAKALDLVHIACSAYANSFRNETFEDYNGHYSRCRSGGVAL